MDVILPAIAEGVDSAVVSFWILKEGDSVVAGQDLVELATDKATFNIPAPKNGVLKKISAQEGTDVQVGDILCIIE